MPPHRSQHYVSQCYLRSFSSCPGGKAINLYNIDLDRCVCNAPIKGQCARNYFYGHRDNLQIEMDLQSIEATYAYCIRLIQTPAARLTDEHLSFLRDFALLQFTRTDIAMKRMRLGFAEFEQVAFDGIPDARPLTCLSERALVGMMMAVYGDLKHYVRDLKSAILTNRTDVSLIASDDPCFFTNRFCIQKLKEHSFGLKSSGLLLFLPLTPRHELICYDKQTYTLSGKQGHHLFLDRAVDIVALNELQYIKAAKNLYFARWHDRGWVGKEFRQLSAERPWSWHQIDAFVPEESGFFRKATDQERREANRTLYIDSSMYPAPRRWLSKLRYRASPKIYSDGSAVGYVRKKEWIRRI